MRVFVARLITRLLLRVPLQRVSPGWSLSSNTRMYGPLSLSATLPLRHLPVELELRSFESDQAYHRISIRIYVSSPRSILHTVCGMLMDSLHSLSTSEK